MKKAQENLQKSLKRLDRLARLLDDRFRIPGTRWRFGLDGLIGLIPGAGDAATSILSAYVVWRAWRMGASRGAWIRMVRNLILDAVLGSIPLLGDFFDIGWKANRRNIGILKEDLRRRKSFPDSRRTGSLDKRQFFCSDPQSSIEKKDEHLCKRIPLKEMGRGMGSFI
ncbi:MAG: DUF4112 domain-containing protein [Desulfobacteraceae bacterium]|nr:MAG: DUF4112 domain-containing protein [Desulfobacteraceae bacterium]